MQQMQQPFNSMGPTQYGQPYQQQQYNPDMIPTAQAPYYPQNPVPGEQYSGAP